MTLITAAAVSVTLTSCADSVPETEAVATEPMAKAVPDVQAMNAFYYYDNVDAAWTFYRDVLGFETVADYGFAKIMRVAPASYLTLVDQAEGMHSSDEPKSVTLAVVTEQVEGWYEYLTSAGVMMRGEMKEYEAGRPHDGFVAIDPEGYLLEFERFNPHPENVTLMPMLAQIEPLGPAGWRPALRTDGPGYGSVVVLPGYPRHGVVLRRASRCGPVSRPGLGQGVRGFADGVCRACGWRAGTPQRHGREGGHRFFYHVRCCRLVRESEEAGALAEDAGSH